ncbi:nitroreductase family protein [Clostridium sp. AL.422]|uniref:nitroreductase family protein n=1 Tax=Clostridium TaxID=1485 RepID=UPI00293DD211|nr:MULTISPECIES: nitroreductase family protein [unclassified Clostridium]MDV4150773.1 nitroreductase family protein [Clostridium sp. AL.422]
MDAITMIKERRSVRKFKNEKVDREVMKEIVDIARWAPSWVNFQIARYTLIDNEEIIQKFANDAVKGFVYNMDTLKNAKGVAVLSFVKGKSGKSEQYGIESSNENTWEVFDAGIACQTFCLAAHAKGIGTCIMGVINEDSIAKIINLPEEETVAALIVYGYPDGEAVPTNRKSAEEIMRFI